LKFLSVRSCTVGAQTPIIALINYFSNISSITKGKINVILREDIELILTGDAQTLFYKSVWFMLLTSNCSVFKYSQWLRSNYIPSSNPKRMLYMLFSIFVTEQYSVNPDHKIDLHFFQAEMQLIKDVLNNLLERVRRGISLPKDSIENGLTRFSSIVTLFDIELDTLLTELKEEIKNGCLLSKYKLSETTTKNQFGEEIYKLDKI
jgi:hypothetical protein